MLQQDATHPGLSLFNDDRLPMVHLRRPSRARRPSADPLDSCWCPSREMTATTWSATGNGKINIIRTTMSRCRDSTPSPSTTSAGRALPAAMKHARGGDVHINGRIVHWVVEYSCPSSPSPWSRSSSPTRSSLPSIQRNASSVPPRSVSVLGSVTPTCGTIWSSHHFPGNWPAAHMTL